MCAQMCYQKKWCRSQPQGKKIQTVCSAHSYVQLNDLAVLDEVSNGDVNAFTYSSYVIITRVCPNGSVAAAPWQLARTTARGEVNVEELELERGSPHLSWTQTSHSYSASN